jgi:hypothetical protein
MHAACEDLEVAVAALDVVFSMLRTVLSMDGPIALPPGPGDLPSQPQGRRHRSHSPSGHKDAVLLPSKEELACKEALWTLSWKAVHDVGDLTYPTSTITHSTHNYPHL